MSQTMYQERAGNKSPGGVSAPPAVFRKSCLVISHKLFYAVNGRYCTEGGFEHYVEVIRSLFERVYLAVPVEHTAPPRAMNPLPEGMAEVIELPNYTERYWYPILRLKHPIALGRPLLEAVKKADVVHVKFPGYEQIIGLALARWKRRPLFCSIVGDWEADYAVSGFAQAHPWLVKPVVLLHRLLIRWVLRSMLVFVHGAAMAERYRRWGRHVVVNQSSNFREADIRSTGGIGELHHPPRLLYAGRLDYKKGVPTLLEALKKLRDDAQHLVLTIVGEGPDRSAFEEQVVRLGLQEAVTFRGHIKEYRRLWEIYRAHDLLILPSLTEGAPKVLIEAYAQGLPVVATNVGGIPGIVSKENGILVEPGDADALAGAIRRIVCEDAYRRRLAEHNLQVAHEKTIEAQVRYMGAHLREAMPDLAEC